MTMVYDFNGQPVNITHAERIYHQPEAGRFSVFVVLHEAGKAIPHKIASFADEEEARLLVKRLAIRVNR